LHKKIWWKTANHTKTFGGKRQNGKKFNLGFHINIFIIIFATVVNFTAVKFTYYEVL